MFPHSCVRYDLEQWGRELRGHRTALYRNIRPMRMTVNNNTLFVHGDAKTGHFKFKKLNKNFVIKLVQ